MVKDPPKASSIYPAPRKDLQSINLVICKDLIKNKSRSDDSKQATIQIFFIHLRSYVLRRYLSGLDDGSSGQVQCHVAGEVEASCEPNPWGNVEKSTTPFPEVLDSVYGLVEGPSVESLPISHSAELGDRYHLSPPPHRDDAGARRHRFRRPALL